MNFVRQSVLSKLFYARPRNHIILGGKYYVPEVAIGYSMAFPSQFCLKAYELLYVNIYVCVIVIDMSFYF